MTVYFPEATKAQGATSVAVVTGALTEAAPTVAQLTAADTSLTISCFLYGTGLEATSETNKGTAPSRACDTTEREEEGRTKWSISDIQYTHRPQADADHADNEARTLMEAGTELWLVERQGLPAKTTAWTAGQFVNLHHVRMGVQRRSKTGDDEFAEYSVTQAVTYIEDPVFDVEVA